MSATVAGHPWFVSFEASAPEVTENAPYSYLMLRLSGSLQGSQEVAVYDDSGALVHTCTLSDCLTIVRPDEDTSVLYQAYLVEGEPPASADEAQPLAISQAVRVTNTGWEAGVSLVSFEASATEVTENSPYAMLYVKWDRLMASLELYTAVYDDNGTLAFKCQYSSTCSGRVRPGEGESRSYVADVVHGAPPATRDPDRSLLSTDPVTVTNVGWQTPASLVSFVASATLVSGNAPYSVLRVQWDHTLPSGFYTAVYDAAGGLAFSCTTAAVCEGEVSPPTGEVATYTAYLVQGSPAATGGPVNPWATSDPIMMSSSGWEPPRSLVSFAASTTRVTSDAPYVTMRVQWDRTLPGGSYTAVYDETGALAMSCGNSAACEVRVVPRTVGAHTYTAYLVGAKPASTGGPVDPWVVSDPITVTNRGDDPDVDSSTVPAIDSVTVLTPVVYENTHEVRIAVDLNKSAYPYYAAVYDETGVRLGYCSSPNVCVFSSELHGGESHTYTAYVVDGTPPATGGPGPGQVGAGVSAPTVTGHGWSNTGVEIDSVSILTPEVHRNSATNEVRIAVDLNHASLFPFYVGVYDETNTRVGYCSWATSYNTCLVSDTLTEGESHTYTAYLTVGTPAASGGPGDARLGEGVASGPVTGLGLTDTGIKITSVKALTPLVYQYGGGSATIVATLNKTSFSPFHVGIYDETGARVGYCSPGYSSSDTGSCLAYDTLAEGESHTYTAYLTAGMPPAAGGPGDAQVGDGTTSDEMTGLGWTNAGVTIDYLRVLTPVVWGANRYVWVTADMNVPFFGEFYLGFYDETGALVRSYRQGQWSEGTNTAYLGWPLLDDVLHTYTAYLTVNAPEAQAPPSNAVGASVISNSVALSTGPTAPEETAGGSNPSEGCKDPCQGDPVNTRTGEFWEADTDLSVAGPGSPLGVTRSFSTTLRAADGEFGHGWSSSYHMGLVVPAGATGSTLADAPDVEVDQENGSTVVFTRQADGSFTAPARVLATLVANADGSFTFTRRQDQVFTFSADGRLVRAEDRNGQGVDLSYDGSGHLVQASNGRGGTITYTWSGDRITQAVDQTGRTVTYTYSPAGDLTEATLPDGSTLGYAYDASHRVTKVTAADGGQTSNTYDTSDRVISQSDPLDRVVSFAYTTDSTTVTDPTGLATVYRFADAQTRSITRAAGTALEATTYYTYGPTNQVVASTDALGRTTWFDYDAAGNRTGVTDPLGRTSTTTYDAWNNPLTVTNAAGETTTMGYDDRGNLVSATNPAGESTTFTVNPDGTVATSTDPLGHTTTYTYDASGFVALTTGPDGAVATTTFNTLGQLVSATDPRGSTAGADPADYTSTFTYDDAGRVLTSTNPLGGVVARAYDAAGRPTTVTNPVDAVTGTEYDLAGQVTATVDGEGNRTTYTYDGAGRVLTVTDPTGAVTTTGYDAAGRPVTVTGPLGRVTTTEYDLASRVTAVVDADGNRTTYAYDAADQLVSVTNALGKTTTTTYDDAGRPVTVTDPLGRTTTTEYDPAGRVTATVSPSGARTTYTYDHAGQLTATTNPLGKTTTTTYDAAGRPVTVTDADGRAVSTAYDVAGHAVQVTRADDSTISWVYDRAGQVTTYTDAAGQDTTYVFDLAGQVTSTTDAAGRTTTYAYDQAGHPTATTFPDQVTADVTYDADGRRTAVDYSDTTPDVSWSYDTAGQVTQVLDGAGTTTYTYDDLGRPTQVTRGTATVGYAFDAAGQVTTLTYPTGETVGYAYDDAGQLATVTDWNAGVYTYDWTNDGQVASVTFPNGVVTTKAHDTAGQTLGITTTNSAGTDMLELAYSYTDAGLLADQTTTRSVTARAPPAPATTAQAYTWDPQARIDAITGDGAGDFTFDTADRLTTLADGRTLTYDTAGQPATLADPAAATTTTYGYDDRGNRTTTTVDDGTTTTTTQATFNAAGQLTGLTDPTGTTTYTYDAAGLRATATTDDGTNQTTETYTWDANASVPVLLTDATHAYVYGTSGTPLAQIDLADQSTVYLHTDLIGSIRSVTDVAGDVVCDADYDTYGQPAAVTTDPCGQVTRFGYAGQYTDPTGLLYLRARYYDPTTGQFLTIDPLVDTTRNPYGYTLGNPLQFVEPLGLDFWQDAGDWAAGFGDTVTLGGTRWIRQKLGVDDVVNYCSDFYQWGGYGGDVANVGLMAVGGVGAWTSSMQRIRAVLDTLDAVESGAGLLSTAGRAGMAVDGAVGTVESVTTAARPAAESGTSTSGGVFARLRAAMADDTGSIRIGGLGDGGVEGATGSVGKLADQFGYTTREVRTAIHTVKREAAFPGNPDVVVDPFGEVYPVGRDGIAGDSIGNILDHLGGGQ